MKAAYLAPALFILYLSADAFWEYWKKYRSGGKIFSDKRDVKHFLLVIAAFVSAVAGILVGLGYLKPI